MYFVSIFFFKHKTAYEMRISDWSSDVCSSDLPLGPVALVAAIPIGVDRRVGIGLPLECFARADVLLVGLIFLALVPAHPQFFTVIDQRRALEQHRQHRGGTQLFRRNAGFRRKPVGVVVSREDQLMRSEEHTSELQSLMRI